MIRGFYAARAGFLGGLRGGDAPERDAEAEFGSDTLSGGSPIIRLGEPSGPTAGDAVDASPGFDPVWGTLRAPIPEDHDHWLGRSDEGAEGATVDVEIFGNGFQISGQIRTGQFGRLSDWLNMQSGFIAVREALLVYLGQIGAPEPDQRKGTLWVRLNQIVMVAEQSAVQTPRPGAPIVAKQRRRVSIVTLGYKLEGSLHVHAHGTMTHFLESPDPHFLPMTDVTARGLSSAAMVARFPFAMVNRQQLVTVLDESEPSSGDLAQTEARSA